MRKACFAKSYYFLFKGLNFKVLLILIFICFLSSMHPLDIGAIPTTIVENNDLLDQYFDTPLSEKLDETNQLPINKLNYYLNNGDYGSVLETITRLSKTEKNIPEIIGIKAAALIGKDDFTAAMNEYNLLKNRNDTSGRPFSIIANMLILKKKPFATIMVCQSGLMRNIKSAKLLYQMGYAYNLLGKTETALAYYKGAESANHVSHELKQPADIEKAIAGAYYKLNDYEKARNALKSNGLKDTDSGITLIINAKYYASKGNYDKAISLLDTAQKSSRYLGAALTKAQFFILNSQPNKAIDLLNDLDIAFRQNNYSDILNLTKALAFLIDGKAEISLDLLEKIKQPEKIQDIHMLKAITYFSMNKKKKAIEELKQTPLPYSELSVLPDFEKYLNQPSIGPDIGLAFFCIDQKFYNRAISIAEKAYKKSQNNILLNFILAECYLKTENFSPAIKELLKINDTFKGSYALQFYLSQAYAKAGMINDASKTYRSLTEARPDFIMANLVYGKLLSDFSKWAEAREVYENGLNFMPDSPQLQMSLGWILVYSDELDSLDNLLQIIEKNKKIEPASLLHLKGWAAFKNNDFPKAEELLTKALETAPGDPEICFHLGMTMMKTDKKDAGKNLLQQSLLFKEQRGKYQDTINKILLQNN